MLMLLSHYENEVSAMAASGSVQSVERVLDILEVLASAPRGLLLSELAAAAQLHVSTAHRLVNVLVDRGYAMKDGTTGKYRLTLRTFELGSRVSAMWDLLSVARPCLDQLAAESEEAVHLVERDGNSVVYLYKAEPYRQLVRMGSHTGLRNPMYCTGVGKSILALMEPEEVNDLWRTQTIIAFSTNTITDLVQMHRELEVTRQRGYALDNEEHEPGVRCMAAAIRNWQGKPVAAVSISAPAARMDEAMIQRMLPKLLDAANQISKMLGFRV